MPFDPDRHHRHSIRLPGYDYSQTGAYYLTLVVEGRDCLFGEIIDGRVHPNSYGQIVSDEWVKSATIRTEIEIGEWVLMPNHLHAIVFIVEDRLPVGAHGGAPSSPPPNMAGAHGRAPSSPPPNMEGAHDQSTTDSHAPLQNNNPKWGSRPRSLSSLLQGFKSATTKQINEYRGTPRTPVWQRNYYEHVVRDEDDLNRIRFYIQENPLHWDDDSENPARVVK